MNWLIFIGVFWVAALTLNIRLANGPLRDTRMVKLLVPGIFGIALLVVWEAPRVRLRVGSSSPFPR